MPLNLRHSDRVLDVFLQFAASSDYGPNERDYKLHVLDTIGRALTGDMLRSDGFSVQLLDAVIQCTPDLNNLTNWRSVADLKTYLQKVPTDRLAQLFGALSGSDDDLPDRIDTFR